MWRCLYLQRNKLPDGKHVGPPEVCALWAGKEGPTLNSVFTNSNWQILLVTPLTYIIRCRNGHRGSVLDPLIAVLTNWEGELFFSGLLSPLYPLLQPLSHTEAHTHTHTHTETQPPLSQQNKAMYFLLSGTELDCWPIAITGLKGSCDRFALWRLDSCLCLIIQ